MSSRKENFYDVLKVDRKSTMAEIVAAYHSARSTFSRDSVATYSLFSPEETQKILARLDEAFHVLSNMERKREYDDRIGADGEGDGGSFPMPGPVLPSRPAPQARIATSSSSTGSARGSADAPAEAIPDPSAAPSVNGSVLRGIREQRQLSVEDVARITKIPAKFIQAIEREEVRSLPARVYLQGFVKNLATLYRLDPKRTVDAYLMEIDRSQPNALT